MTIRKWLENYLADNGLFPNQATAVVAAMIAEHATYRSDMMAGRWDDCAEDYPRPLLAVLCLDVRRHAVVWIDANIPQHWARVIFAQEAADAAK